MKNSRTTLNHNNQKKIREEFFNSNNEKDLKKVSESLSNKLQDDSEFNQAIKERLADIKDRCEFDCLNKVDCLKRI